MNETKKMNWIAPAYSKNKVRKAGEVLKEVSPPADKLSEALAVLSNWRAAHAYPMHAIAISLRRRAKDVDRNAVVVQRLKRLPSIRNKLLRFTSMKLDRMQDIGGCRAVVSSVKRAEQLAEELAKSRTRNELHSVTNYVDTPQESGYRSIHLVYKYRGRKDEFENLFVEVQVRSRIQHAWATAVEIVDTFTSQALKFNAGEELWAEFFACVSAEFARLERRPIAENMIGVDTLSRTVELEGELRALSILRDFASLTEYIDRKGGSSTEYFLLEIDHSQDIIKVSRFDSRGLELATKLYTEIEQRARENTNLDVVLVAADSIAKLKRAYPNYFADSREFRRQLLRVLDSA